jgi:hypothetical protein
MNPTRLIESGEPMGRSLLEAARGERPRRGNERRVLVAALLVSWCSTCGVVKGPRLFRWLLGAVLAVVAGAGIIVGGSRLARPHGSPAATGVEEARVERAPAADPAPTASERPRSDVPPAEALAKEGAPASAPRPKVVRRSTGSSGEGGPRVDARLSNACGADEEIEEVRSARVALRAGDGAVALQILDSLPRRCPRRSFAEEEDAIRVQGLVVTGQREAARRAGEAFLAAHPRSAYGLRVREALLGIP